MTEGAVREKFEQAIKQHRDGSLPAAETLYREVLRFSPEHAAALHLLGLAVLERGRPAEGLDLISRAIAIEPGTAVYRLSLGQALAALRRLDDSVAAYREATRLAPELVDAWFGLGVALQTAGRPNEAIDAYRHLLTLEPDHVDACNNLGSALESSGHVDKAIEAYRRALELEPRRAATHNNLSSAYYRAGRMAEAIAAARQARQLDPNSVVAANNLACGLIASRQFDEAVAVLRQGLAVDPHFAEAWHNLAKALKEQGKRHEALAAARRFAELAPDRPEAHLGLGNVLHALGQFAAAAGSYQRAIVLRPDDVEAWNNRGNALRSAGHLDAAIGAFQKCLALEPSLGIAHGNLGNALKDVGRIEEAIESFRRAVELCPSDAISHSNLAYAVTYHPGYDPPAILDENRRWNAQHAVKLAGQIERHANRPDPERRLKIGYVGADFRDHCQSLFTVPLLAHHDRERFEIFCYANVARPDALTARLKNLSDCWRDTAGSTDAEVAKQVRADGIDILVDLTMHMSNGRPLLMALKPAPVEVAWLAYPGTTGLSAVDYRLTDPYLDPPGESDQHYSERSLRLPETFWCYDPLTAEPKPNALPAGGHSRGRVTFGCLNNFCKVTDRSLELWSRVLSVLDDSRFLLLAPPGEHRGRVLAQFERHHIDPARVAFAAYRPRPDYLELYHQIDVCLDTLPYNGHTTSLDSFWMGVPVVTRVGATVVGRAGCSQLSNLGLSELVAWNDDEFVSIAVALARDIARLAELRATLRQRMEHSPLMDAARFTRNLETAYRRMWIDWCRPRNADAVKAH